MKPVDPADWPSVMTVPDVVVVVDGWPNIDQVNVPLTGTVYPIFRSAAGSAAKRIKPSTMYDEFAGRLSVRSGSSVLVVVEAREVDDSFVACNVSIEVSRLDVIL